MRYLTALIAGSAFLMTTGCVRTATHEATGDVDVDVESPTKQGEDWSGRIRGTGSWTGLNGNAEALVHEGRTGITISLNGATPNAMLAWHIHEGTCAAPGMIFGDVGQYMPLMVATDGRATGSAQLSFGLDEAKDYVVDVHPSASDVSTIIACGDLDD